MLARKLSGFFRPIFPTEARRATISSTPAWAALYRKTRSKSPGELGRALKIGKNGMKSALARYADSSRTSREVREVPTAVIAAIRRTGFMEYRLDSGSASVRLDVEGSDHLAPLFGFGGNELCKVAGRDDKRRASKVGKPCLHLGIGEARVDLLVELVDDLGRRGLRCADAIPCARLVAWHELSHSWDARQRVRAHRGRYRERPQPAGLDVLNRHERRDEQDLHLSAEQVRYRRRSAAIRHVHHVDPRHHLEQLARHMGCGSVAGRCHVDLAGVRLGIGDELGNGLGRDRWMDHHDEWRATDACNRRKVAKKNEI